MHLWGNTLFLLIGGWDVSLELVCNIDYWISEERKAQLFRLGENESQITDKSVFIQQLALATTEGGRQRSALRVFWEEKPPVNSGLPHKGPVMQKAFPCHDNALQWRHNGRDSVSNNQSHHCLLNGLFRRRSKKTSSSASLAFVRGIHRWPVNSPLKWPVTRKMFPLDDVIMWIGISLCQTVATSLCGKISKPTKIRH